MKIVGINPNNVEFDELNPNMMNEKEFKNLKKEIKKRGFIQPIVIREVDGKTIVIDGEHRLKAAKELGLEEIPAINLGEVSDEEARIMLVNLNRIKGEFDPIKFAFLIENLESNNLDLTKEIYLDERELNSYRLLRKTQEVNDKEIKNIIEDFELENEVIRSKIILSDDIEDFEINKEEGIVKIGERVIPRDRIKKLQIMFDKKLAAILHIEILPKKKDEE